MLRCSRLRPAVHEYHRRLTCHSPIIVAAIARTAPARASPVRSVAASAADVAARKHRPKIRSNRTVSRARVTPTEVGLSGDRRDPHPHAVSARRHESRALGYLSLFTSVGTLLCCALPSLFVFFGLGATVATVLSTAPWLVAISHHRNWVFTLSSALIAANFYYVYHIAPRLLIARGVCSRDDPGACARATRLSRFVFWTSVSLLAIGFLTAYVLPAILERIDS